MSERDPLITFLAESPVFAGLGADVLAQIANALHPTTFDPGQTIFSRGETGRELIMILDGRIKVSILTADGRELAFTHLGAGELLGEIAMLDGGPRTADAVALVRTRAMVLSWSAAEALLHQSPELAIALIRYLCRRLRDADLQLEGVALHRIEVRLARYLLVRCRQLKPGVDDGSIDIRLAISQGELAVLLGASRPKVNGALSLLEDRGVIVRRGEKLTCSVEDLCEIAEID